ncbi:hypothetical protein ACHAWF_015079 [Thalassiosira exigua]
MAAGRTPIDPSPCATAAASARSVRAPSCCTLERRIVASPSRRPAARERADESPLGHVVSEQTRTYDVLPALDDVNASTSAISDSLSGSLGAQAGQAAPEDLAGSPLVPMVAALQLALDGELASFHAMADSFEVDPVGPHRRIPCDLERHPKTLRSQLTELLYSVQARTLELETSFESARAAVGAASRSASRAQGGSRWRKRAVRATSAASEYAMDVESSSQSARDSTAGAVSATAKTHISTRAVSEATASIGIADTDTATFMIPSSSLAPSGLIRWRQLGFGLLGSMAVASNGRQLVHD